jgi:phage shock protein E
MNNSKRTIVDVRSNMEFIGGHPQGAINIPLHEIPNRLDEFRNMAQPLILCCASGNRSGQACQFLHANNINAENGGSWLAVNFAQTELAQ